MPGVRAQGGIVLAVLVGCGVGISRAPTEVPPEPAATAAVDLETAPGGVLEATVPLIDGSAVALSDLRGRVVLLEVSATSRPHWAPAQAVYRELVDELGDERVAVVSVAADPDSSGLRADWDRDKPPFLLAWDPQGALALRLGIRVLPTAVVLDPGGRVAATIAGQGDDGRAFADRVAATVRDVAAR
jgi:peroxiredoxin